MAADARVGPYRIIRLVNRGGQGSVYLGYDKRLHRRVAIKIYALPVARGARKRLLSEAQLVASMQSPKVVQIHDVIESREHLAMVMEYVPGCDLDEFLKAVKPSISSILTITADIAGALTVARQQGIVHGDVKASNVLIGTNGRVKLTDFGIARGAEAGTAQGGSPAALSPEQYLGKPLDGRSDLFALGCLLYRMVCGVHPFFREGRLDRRALLELPAPPLEQRVSAGVELPQALLELAMALLQKDPADRPSSTRVVRQILRRAGRDIPLAASNSLLQEARPCFRTESPEDIPPVIPPDLAREGRSSLVGTHAGRVGAWPQAISRGWRWPALVASLAVVGGLTIMALLAPSQTRVHIEAPVLRVATDAELPGEVSGRWLVAEVTAAMHERVGSLTVTGPLGAAPATTLYADPARREAQDASAEQLRLDLRCVDLLCVFAMTRRWQGQQANQQAVLFPDMSAQQWRDIVRDTTRALYP